MLASFGDAFCRKGDRFDVVINEACGEKLLGFKLGLLTKRLDGIVVSTLLIVARLAQIEFRRSELLEVLLFNKIGLDPDNGCMTVGDGLDLVGDGLDSKGDLAILDCTVVPITV